MGLFEKAVYETSEIKLAPRDLLLLFTDGLYEVHSPKNQIYTKEMLQAATQKHLKKPVAQLFDVLLKEVQDFAVNHAFDDDVCMVGLEYTGGKAIKRG